MIQPIGYFKLWRELMTKPIWLDSTPEQKTILITLLAMANFNGKEWEWQGKSYKAERGQFVTSLDSIVKNCGKGVSLQNVRTALERFEKYEFLTNESTNKNRLITIVNWASYQQSDNELTSNSTSNQQATNKQVTTREEVKKERKKELSIRNQIPPTEEMVKSYCIERTNTVDINKWFSHYESNGWMVGKNKMKDWQATIRTWENSTINESKKPQASKLNIIQVSTLKEYRP